LDPETRGAAPPLLRAEASFAQRERTLSTHMKRYWRLESEPKRFFFFFFFFFQQLFCQILEGYRQEKTNKQTNKQKQTKANKLIYSYYEDKNKLTTQQKLRRIQREKKLKKFFGDTPDFPNVRSFSRE